MLSTIDEVASYVGSATGFSKESILAQIIAEVGHNFPANNNFANILFFGNVGEFGQYPWQKNATLKTRLANGGWLIDYDTPQAGADAYVLVLLDMALIRFYRSATWFTHSPESDCLILAASPWDAQHYGGNGSHLFDALQWVLANPGSEPTPSEPTPSEPVPAEPTPTEVVTAGEVDYTVQPGDTLWGIATAHLAPGGGPYTSAEMWHKIWAIVHATYGANMTVIPMIHPGDILKIPVGL